MTSLLVLTNKPEDLESFKELFEEVVFHSLADISVNSGYEPKVKVQDRDVKEFDAVYLDPEPKASIYSKVFLEALQDESVTCNLKPNTFFILSKKHYLFKVLKEKGVSIPPTVAVPSQKGLTAVEQDLEFPVVGKMYKNFKREDIAKLEDCEELNTFAERGEYGNSYVLVQEFQGGEVFDILYIDGDIISLRVEGTKWSEEDISRNYHTISADQKEEVRKAAESIGTPICRVRMVGDKIVQVKSQLNLPMFKKISGKNVFGKIAKVLKGDED